MIFNSACNYQNFFKNCSLAITHFALLCPLHICIFLGGTSFFQHFDIQKSIENIRQKFFRTFNIAIYFWPIINIAIYSICPQHLRLLMFDLFAFNYSIMLSYINNNSIDSKGPYQSHLQGAQDEIIIQSLSNNQSSST